MDLKIKYNIENILIIEYISLPENIQIEISYWNNFGNCRYLQLYSELEKITLENYNKFLSDKDNEFEEPLIIEKFLIDSKIDLTNVDEILFHICW